MSVRDQLLRTRQLLKPHAVVIAFRQKLPEIPDRLVCWTFGS